MRSALLLVFPALCAAQVAQQFSVPLDPGSGTVLENNMAADSMGNTYVLTAVGDVRVTKLDSHGNIVYARQVGGSSDDTATAITADAAGNVWVAGFTRSADFPATVPPLAPFPENPPYTLLPSFFLKLDATGKVIYASTVPYSLGIRALATDASGALYVTGSIDFAEPRFVSTPGAFQNPSSGQNAFAMKLTPAGDRIAWATALGGAMPACRVQNNCPVASNPLPGSFPPQQEYEYANTIAVDPQGNVIIGGLTDDVDFPTTAGAFQSTCNCRDVGWNGFVTKLSADGSHLLYSTYVGAASKTAVQALAITSTGDVWIAGAAPVPFPVTPGAAWTAAADPAATPGFLAKLKNDGSALQNASYLIGTGSVVNVAGLVLNTDGTLTAGATTQYGAGLALGFDATASKPLFNAALVRSQIDQGFAGGSAWFAMAGSGGVVTRFDATASTGPAVFELTDSATLRAQGQIAPGELVTFFGARLGPQAGIATSPVNSFYPVQAGGTQVLFDGAPAPLLYVSAGQVNAVVPYEIFGRDRVTVQLVSSTGSASYTYRIVDSAPAVFEDTTALVFNQDGTRNTQDNPASRGSIATIYASGAGMMVNPAGVTGRVSTSLSQTELPVSLEFLIGGDKTTTATITYAGAAPTLISGMLQINFVVPVGPNTFRLRLGDAASRLVNIFTR